MNAFKLLNRWETIPGIREDGSVDSDILFAWVQSAREECRKIGRLKVCDRMIGRLLASSPKESDDTWPCIAVRDIIEDEEIISEDSISVFVSATLTEKEATIRSFDGVARPERELAKQFSAYAQACQRL